VQNTVFSALTKAQGAILSYITTLILLHALSVEGYGLYSVLFVGVVANLSLLLRFGIANVLTRFIPEYYSQGNFRVIARLFSMANLIQTASAALLAVIAWIFAPQLATLIRFPGSENVLRIFAVGAAAYLLTENFRILFGGVFQQRVILIVNFIYAVIRLAALYIATRTADPLFSVMIAESALYVFLLAAYYIAYRLLVRPRIEEHPDHEIPPPWRRFTRYAGLYYLNELGLTLINQATDLFIVSGLLGDLAVGLYGLANRILQLATQVLPNKVFGDVIEPLFFSEYGEARKQEAQFGFNMFLKVTLLTALPIGIWISLMGRPLIVELFDARYADAAMILTVSGLILPMIAMRMPLGLILQNAERPDLLLIAKLTGVLKIVLGLMLVRQWGVMAMVWVTFSTTLAELIVNFSFVATKLHVRTDFVGLLRLGINSLIAAALFYPLRPFFAGRIGVIISIPLFAALYLGINLLHKTFRAEEREFINSKMPYPLWKF
jgi:O-antigen/teichoic acid export membrane protein